MDDSACLESMHKMDVCEYHIEQDIGPASSVYEMDLTYSNPVQTSMFLKIDVY